MVSNRIKILLLLAGFTLLSTCIKVKDEMMATTGEVTNIQQNSAEASGMIVELGRGVTEHGHCYAKTPNVSINNLKTTLGIPAGNGGFTSLLPDLEAGTKYYIKAYLRNGKDIVYGKEISFSTLAALLPEITTKPVTDITQQGANSGGNITSDGGAPVTARGICWNTSTGPTITNNKTTNGAGTGNYTSNLSGLSLSTTYYVRAYATNSTGTGYGNEIYFTTAAVAVIPPVTTTDISAITINSAVSGGTISNDGGAPVTDRGVCWSTTINPTIASFKTSNGTGIGNFPSNLTGLNSGTTYYVCAFATNNVGTGYGNQLTFTTSSDIPVVTTSTISSVTGNTASGGGNVSSDGGAAITARGVCWSTSVSPTLSNNKTTDGVGTGSFVSNLTGLNPTTLYYVRAYATNNVGTAYGTQVSFTSGATIPTVITSTVSSVSSATATCGGNITSDGGASVTSRGVCWNIAPGPTTSNSKTSDGGGTGTFVSSLTGLNANTTYYIRAYAINSVGTAYGTEYNFKSGAGIPSITTAPATSITETSATSGGNITNDGGASIIARGVCWRTSKDPTISDNLTTNGSVTGSFTSNITGLSPLTTYYVRAYATNSSGTAYGNEVNFTTIGPVPPIPTNISASPGKNEVTIKWKIVSEATGYNMYWSTTPGVSKTNFTGKITNITTNSYQLSGLTSGTTYYFVVSAKNESGESNESIEAIATPPLLLQTNTLSVIGEKHFYQVTVSSGQSLFINTHNVDNRNDFYLYVKYGSLPAITDYDTLSSTGDDEAITITNTLAGTYYIMVYASSFYSDMWGQASGGYTITASTDVTALCFGTTYAANISNVGEKHYYEVTVTSGKSLFVTTINTDNRNDFYLYVKYGSLPTTFNYDGKSETGESEATSITNTQSGTYYIMVYAKLCFSDMWGQASGNYTIISFTSK
jgi:hypothetical protein